MVDLLSLFALAFAVSLDGFGVGVSYGLRKIRIPINSILIITSCSALMVIAAMEMGEWLSRFFSMHIADQFGAWILIGVGCWAIFNLYQNKETYRNNVENVPIKQESKQVFKLEIKMLGLVIHILKTPTVADMDNSGTITGGEAALLGIALSLDAFGAGVGAALMGYSPWMTGLFVSILSTVFIGLGLRLGFVYSEIGWMKNLAYIPGIILILFGILKIW